MSLKFLHVENTDTKDFDSFVKIYTNAFKEDELEPLEIVKHRIETKRYVLTLAIKDKKVLGFYLLDIVQKYKFAILTFLAVDEAFRGLSYGTALCENSIKYVLALKDIKYFLIEAKDRQSVFYEKLGFKILGLDYAVPNFDDAKSTQTNLMMFPNQDETVIQKDKLKKIIKDIFMDGYQVKEDDLRLINQLKKIPEKISWEK